VRMAPRDFAVRIEVWKKCFHVGAEREEILEPPDIVGMENMRKYALGGFRKRRGCAPKEGIEMVMEHAVGLED
jgi:hypothetical protein